MADYKNFKRPGNFRPRPQGASMGPRDLFDAQCNKCGERCQVPFRPNGKKPVYCANCFTKDDQRSERPRPFAKDFAPRPSFRSGGTDSSIAEIQDLKRQIVTMNVTLEKLVTAVDTFNRATALTKEIRKHFPDEKASAPKKAVKKAVTKPAKAVSARKKPAKS